MSNTWSATELATLTAPQEVHVVTHRADGTPRSPRIIWIVRATTAPSSDPPTAGPQRGSATPSTVQGESTPPATDTTSPSPTSPTNTTSHWSTTPTGTSTTATPRSSPTSKKPAPEPQHWNSRWHTPKPGLPPHISNPTRMATVESPSPPMGINDYHGSRLRRKTRSMATLYRSRLIVVMPVPQIAILFCGTCYSDMTLKGTSAGTLPTSTATTTSPSSTTTLRQTQPLASGGRQPARTGLRSAAIVRLAVGGSDKPGEPAHPASTRHQAAASNATTSSWVGTRGPVVMAQSSIA